MTRSFIAFALAACLLSVGFASPPIMLGIAVASALFLQPVGAAFNIRQHTPRSIFEARRLGVAV